MQHSGRSELDKPKPETSIIFIGYSPYSHDYSLIHYSSLPLPAVPLHYESLLPPHRHITSSLF